MDMEYRDGIYGVVTIKPIVFLCWFYEGLQSIEVIWINSTKLKVLDSLKVQSLSSTRPIVCGTTKGHSAAFLLAHREKNQPKANETSS